MDCTNLGPDEHDTDNKPIEKEEINPDENTAKEAVTNVEPDEGSNYEPG